MEISLCDSEQVDEENWLIQVQMSIKTVSMIIAVAHIEKGKWHGIDKALAHMEWLDSSDFYLAVGSSNGFRCQGQK